MYIYICVCGFSTVVYLYMMYINIFSWLQRARFLAHLDHSYKHLYNLSDHPSARNTCSRLVWGTFAPANQVNNQVALQARLQ